MSEGKSKKREAFDSIKEIVTLMKEAAKSKTELPMHRNEDDYYRGFDQKSCPHGLCDGSGYTTQERPSGTVSIHCQCYEDAVLNIKLKNSKIQPNFWNVELNNLTFLDDKISISHLKPKLNPEERKIDKRKKTIDPETPTEFTERTYDQKLIRKGIHYFSENYITKVLEFMEENPRKKTLNLMLMGDPGKGKTHMACAIAKEFMRKGKTVHFTRMRTLLDEAYDNKNEIRELVRTKDLLIIDELGQEYHTDSQWALKQIQDIFKERQETGLPIICTTNAYPNELESYYEGSLMSTFHGRFLMMMLYGDYDLRILEARKTYDELDFLND